MNGRLLGWLLVAVLATTGTVVALPAQPTTGPTTTPAEASDPVASVPDTTLDAPEPEWSDRLRTALGRLASAVESVEGERTGEKPISVGQMFEATRRSSAVLQQHLSEVSAANQSLADLAAEARRHGYDASRYSEVTGAVSRWVTAMWSSADPGLCRQVLPADAEEWEPRRLSDYRPYLDCLEEEAIPRSRAVADAASALVEAFDGAVPDKDA